MVFGIKKRNKTAGGESRLKEKSFILFFFCFISRCGFGTIPHASSEHVKGESREREAGPEQRKTQDRKGATAWAECWENGFWSENFSFLGANDTDFRMQRVERAEDPLAGYLYFSCGIRFGAVF